MKYNEVLSIPLGLAVCYSGYREGQKPGDSYPSYEQVKEDLLIVQKQWKYIRLYSCDQHSNTVLEVIQNEKLNLRVMLGAFIEAEVNNPNCPWGGSYNKLQLAQNIENNLFQMNKLIELANEYPNIIFSLSVGNEACVDWTDHLVPVESVIKYVEMVKSSTSQPVTFCENYVPWLDKLEPLVDIIDFISIHTYPVWEYKTIDQGMQYTIQNYNAVANKYPNKLVVITRGEKGAVAVNKNEIVECSAKDNLKIKDLTGAGDLFAAGYLHGYINNFSEEDCLKMGTHMASKIIQKIGARL